MTDQVTTRVVSVLLEDDLLALNRAIGIIRRRQLPTEAIQVGPAGPPGTLRLSLVLGADPAAVDRLASQLRRMIGVRDVALWEEHAVALWEAAVIRVRAAARCEAALLDVLALYDARLIAAGEATDEALVEGVGTPPLLTSLIRALEPFGVLEVTRSGPLPMARPTGKGASVARPDLPAGTLAAANA